MYSVRSVSGGRSYLTAASGLFTEGEECFRLAEAGNRGESLQWSDHSYKEKMTVATDSDGNSQSGTKELIMPVHGRTPRSF